MSGMSDQARAWGYVSSILALDPNHDLDGIWNARQAYLGRTAATGRESDSPERTALPRQVAIDRARDLVSEVWTRPVDEVLAELERVHWASYPELRRLGGRLSTIARSREALLRLVRDRTSFAGSFDVIAGILTSTAATSERLRRKIDRYDSPVDLPFRVLGTQPWSFDLGEAVRFLRRVRRHLPEVYELEGEWFASLEARWRRYRRRRLWIWALMVFLLGSVVLSLTVAVIAEIRTGNGR